MLVEGSLPTLRAMMIFSEMVLMIEARCITVYLQYNNLDLYSSYSVQP